MSSAAKPEHSPLGTGGDNSPGPLFSDPISTVNRLLQILGAYPLLLIALFVGYQQLKDKSGIKNFWPLAAIISIPIVLVLLFHTFPAWMRHHRRRLLEEIGIKGRLNDPGYFRLGPYEATDQQFNRADGAHLRILRWLRESKVSIQYLTGFSGTGKTSLLQASVLPKLSTEQPQFQTVQARTFGEPLVAIRDAVLEPGSIWKRPPSTEQNVRIILERACEHIHPRPLLLVLDQFEEFVILHQSDEQKEFLDFLLSLSRTPIPGLKLLLVVRSDYLGQIGEIGLPSLEQHTNWEEIGPFTEREALQFLDDSGLNIGVALKRKILKEARELEETPGLVRPITLNLFGMILKRSSERLPRPYRPGSLLRSYVKHTLSRPDIRAYAPRIVTAMLTEHGTKYPRALTELATDVNSQLIRGCLIRLGDEGLVRELDPKNGIWEISHDFIARLLHYQLASWRINLRRRLQPWLAPAAIILWLASVAWLLPIYQQNRELAAREQLDRLGVVVTPSNNIEGLMLVMRQDSFVDDKALKKAVAALKHLHDLTDISLESQPLVDITSLDKLRDVRAVNLSKTKVSDLSPLGKMHNLIALNISETPVSDLSVLAKLHNLKHLNLNGTRIKNFSSIGELRSLEDLAANGSSMNDLRIIAALTNLRSLVFSGTKVADLSPVQDMRHLLNINAVGSQIADLHPLSSLNELERLYLGSTKVSDLSPLSGLPKLTVLDLGKTRVSDLTPLQTLKELKYLNLSGTKSIDFSSFPVLDKLEELDISDIDIYDLSFLGRLRSFANPDHNWCSQKC